MDAVPFWKRKSLSEMSKAEWESLCDGCAKCCLEKLEDSETGHIEFTDVACKLLDIGVCRCKQYATRKRIVPDCEVLTPDNILALSWIPATCAYRRLAEGKGLPDWHPLVTGDPESVHRAGVSVRGRVISEDDVDNPEDLEDRIVTWPAEPESP